MGVLSGLKPVDVFKYFEDICSIPHGSFNLEAIGDYVVRFALDHHLPFIRDDYGNIVIYKEASKGYEKSEPIILQGHLDMVCEKNYENAAKFDFTKDPLKLAVMDDYVFAKGTSLGGDDGIAVAMMLAVLADDIAAHPPIEAVFTCDEEVGMLGAAAFDAGCLKGKRMINIDQEQEGIFISSCAGGRKVTCKVPVRFSQTEGMCYDIVVCGLMGGHSGTEIDKYHGNANLLMGRLLHFIGKSLKYDLAAISGGLQDNAIPRESKAKIVINPKDADHLEELVSKFEKTLQHEYRTVERNLTIYCVSKGNGNSKVLSPKTRERIIFLLMTIPDGIQKMSPDTDNLVQTSSNVGIMRLLDDSFELIASLRSSVSSEKEALCDKMQYLTETIGGTFTTEGDYPAWEYKEDSQIRDIMFDAYQEYLGKNPQIIGIHAGLECGIFADKIPGLDIVAFGPDIEDIHTPKEKLSVPSVERMYNLLLLVLEKLK